MLRYILHIILIYRFVASFEVTQENFALKSLNESWARVEKANFTANTFTMHLRIMKTIHQYNVRIKGYQRITGQMKPTPFNWNIDYCRLAANPIKYNFVIGSFYLAMSRGNNLAKKCPVPAGYFYEIDDFVFSSDYFPRFFPPGHFMFNITFMSGQIKFMTLLWVWNISHAS